mmetsp:Transcript_3858/g.24474  ORF Transcript_3858/g.24474 Transcript_3858/m.24474 type:complete len:631 (-) Transcript_3858:5848-7740(-)
MASPHDHFPPVFFRDFQYFAHLFVGGSAQYEDHHQRILAWMALLESKCTQSCAHQRTQGSGHVRESRQVFSIEEHFDRCRQRGLVGNWTLRLLPRRVGHLSQLVQHFFHPIVQRCISFADLCLGHVHHVHQPRFQCGFFRTAHQPCTHRASEHAFFFQVERRGAHLQLAIEVRAGTRVGQSGTCACVDQGFFIAAERVDGTFQGRGGVSATCAGHGDFVFVRPLLPSFLSLLVHVFFPLARLSHRRRSRSVPTHVARGFARKLAPRISSQGREEVRAPIHEHHRGLGRVFARRRARQSGHGACDVSAVASTCDRGRHASAELRHRVHQSDGRLLGHVHVHVHVGRASFLHVRRHDQVRAFHVRLLVFRGDPTDGAAQGALPRALGKVQRLFRCAVHDVQRKMEGFRRAQGRGAHVHRPVDDVHARFGHLRVVERVAPRVHASTEGFVGVLVEGGPRGGGVRVLGTRAKHAHVVGAVRQPASHAFHRQVQVARPQQQHVALAHQALRPRVSDVAHAQAIRASRAQERHRRRHGLARADVRGHHASAPPLRRRHARFRRRPHACAFDVPDDRRAASVHSDPRARATCTCTTRRLARRWRRVPADPSVARRRRRRREARRSRRRRREIAKRFS